MERDKELGLAEVLEKDEYARRLYDLICESENDIGLLLWNLFFDVDVSDFDGTRDEILKLGRKLNSKNYLGRLILVRLYQLLEQEERAIYRGPQEALGTEIIRMIT